MDFRAVFGAQARRVLVERNDLRESVVDDVYRTLAGGR